MEKARRSTSDEEGRDAWEMDALSNGTRFDSGERRSLDFASRQRKPTHVAERPEAV